MGGGSKYMTAIGKRWPCILFSPATNSHISRDASISATRQQGFELFCTCPQRKGGVSAVSTTHRSEIHSVPLNQQPYTHLQKEKLFWTQRDAYSHLKIHSKLPSASVGQPRGKMWMTTCTSTIAHWENMLVTSWINNQWFNHSQRNPLKVISPTFMLTICARQQASLIIQMVMVEEYNSSSLVIFFRDKFSFRKGYHIIHSFSW